MDKGALLGAFFSCAKLAALPVSHLPDLPVCGPCAVRHAGSMENELVALSNELAGAVEHAGRAVVAVNARPRFASSGVLWRPGIIVTAEHTIRRREEIGITLPDGRTTSATLAGRDAGTDLAVLTAGSGRLHSGPHRLRCVQNSGYYDSAGNAPSRLRLSTGWLILRFFTA